MHSCFRSFLWAYGEPQAGNASNSTAEIELGDGDGHNQQEVSDVIGRLLAGIG